MGEIVVVIIILVVLAFANKVQEARKIAEREREQRERRPQQLSAEARRKIYGEHQTQTATAREGATPPPPPPARPVRKPRPIEQELLETLFGVKLSAEESDESGRQPNVRQATQQMVERLRGSGQPQAKPAQAWPRSWTSSRPPSGKR